MKFGFDKKAVQIGLIAFLVIAASIVFYLILSQLGLIRDFFMTLVGILKPVLYGLIFGYLMNPLVRFFERRWFKKIGEKAFPDREQKACGLARGLSVAASLATVLAIVAVLLWMVLPRLYESLELLATNLSTYLAQGQTMITESFPEESDARTVLLNLYNSVSEYATKWFNGDALDDLSNLLISISTGIYSVLREILNMIIGLIVAVYVLMSRERFAAQSKKVLYSVFSIRLVNRLLQDLRDANQIFSRYISGVLLDSLMVGIVCFISLSILQMPYKELVSVMVGVTNVIPFFGPFLGAIPSAFLILLINPLKCLVFLLFILVLQQVDGNIMAPKILGESTGLGSFWVICATLVGGGLFGFVGMLFGVPVFAVFYKLIKRWVERSLQKRRIPPKTSAFRQIVRIDEETEQPVYREQEETPPKNL